MSDKPRKIDDLILIINELKSEIICLKQDIIYIKEFLSPEFTCLEKPESPKANYYSWW